MRRGLLRGLGTLAVCLGLAVTVRGQWSGLSVLFDPPAQPPFAPVNHKQALPGAAFRELHRLVETLVELAWLADPLTGPCDLEARADGGTMQVRGIVPSRAVRERAVKLAQLTCPMAVVDGLKVRAVPALSSVQPGLVPAGDLQRVAGSRLQASFPGHTFQVHCDGNGKIRVSGLARCLDEKLAVSRSLHKLRGCRCVENHLVLSTDSGSEPGNGHQVGHDAVSTPQGDKALTSGLPAKTTQKTETHPTPVSPPQNSDSTGSYGQMRTASGVPARLPDSVVLAPILKSSSSPSDEPYGRVSTTGTGTNGVTRTENVPLSDTGIRQAQYLPAARTNGVTTRSSTYVSHGLLLVPESPTSPRTAAPAPKKEQPAVKNQPAVPQKKPAPKTAPPAPKKDPAVLKMEQRIAQACGKAATDVQVRFSSAHRLQITLRAANRAEGERLARKVLNLPELLSYHIDLSVKVPR
jgi:hypothetical protein